MTPETKATILEALRYWGADLEREGYNKWDLLPLERKYKQGRGMDTRSIQRRRIAKGLWAIRRAQREMRSDINLGGVDCE